MQVLHNTTCALAGPWATGDRIREHGDGENLCLYGGAYVGLLGALIVPTNVSAIPAFDLLTTDWHHDPRALPSFLLYNPFPTLSAPLIVGLPLPQLPPDARVSVYDAVTQEWIATNVSVGGDNRLVGIAVPPQSAVVASIVPAGASIRTDHASRRLYADGSIIDYAFSPPV